MVLLSAQELAERWKVKVPTVYQMVYRGQIPFVKLGSSRYSALRFPAEEIERYELEHYHHAIKDQANLAGVEEKIC